MQWSPDAIWFDNDESWETPNWEVQKLFGNNVGDEVAPSTFDGPVNAPEDIGGGVFLSTWSTSAAYDNVTVTSNDTGATLFSDEFADGTQWSPQTGTWAADGGRYVQSSTSVNDARSIINGAYAKDWTNYTLELDATKLAGAEGFLVGFGAKAANDFYWWNLGGWNNTRSVLQRANGGSANEVKALEGTERHDRPDLPRQGRRRRHEHQALPRRRAADVLRPAAGQREGLPGRHPRQGHRRPGRQGGQHLDLARSAPT